MNKPLTKEDFDLVDVDAAFSEENAEADAARKKKRKRLFILFALIVAKLGLGWFAWTWFAHAGRIETDNAYVGADTASITPLVSGSVAQVLVSDAQEVRAGQPLVILDQTDARLAVAEAEAAYDQARRRVHGYAATSRQLSAQIAMRGAEGQRASAEVASAATGAERARLDYARRSQLAESGAVSGEEVSSTRAAYEQARAGVAAARAAQSQASAAAAAAAGQRDANQAMIAGAGVDDNPEVAAARARLDRARLDLQRTVIRAPVSGIVASRQVQIGQRVQPGSALMRVVPVQEAYVDANFKEGELTEVRVGQPVELHADLYGEEVVFHGRVVGLAGGTGSAFALIPAQNATGNWIKVVQRVPVRIRLDPAELRRHPLRVGLSMTAIIDTRG
ncbi:MAG TPA: HlyD family efflux transporter periplasmic adaptor subunit [Allosphingosinicella sp.]|nr:HlyD family efflux transporter periplasmic adaptor subunit [Allosphingosinicella sp.]